jgi:hypothetical protein
MSEYPQTKFRGDRVAILGRRSEMVFFPNLWDLDSTVSASQKGHERTLKIKLYKPICELRQL